MIIIRRGRKQMKERYIGGGGGDGGDDGGGCDGDGGIYEIINALIETRYYMDLCEFRLKPDLTQGRVLKI